MLFESGDRAQGLLVLQQSKVYPRRLQAYTVLQTNAALLEICYCSPAVQLYSFHSSIFLLEDQWRLNTSSFSKWSLQDYKSNSNRTIGANVRKATLNMYAQSTRGMGLSWVRALGKSCSAGNDFSLHLCNLLPPQPQCSQTE